MAKTIEIDGVTLHLAHPDSIPMKWIGNERVREQLAAAWLVVDEADIPLTPRLLGKPGVGKTTLAYAVARSMDRDVYIMQCTMDTRPEDLLVTPVLAGQGAIAYHASPLVTAMLTGSTCVLDEGNRMSEKSWASLAPLMDQRRYVESIVAGIKIRAHRDFRLCVTMNDDASTYEIPEYIQSRLQPQIEVTFPTREEEMEILRFNVPFSDTETLQYVADFLQKAHTANLPFTSRDGVNILRYAMKVSQLTGNPSPGCLVQSIESVLGQDGVDFMDSGHSPHQTKGSRLKGEDEEPAEKPFDESPFSDEEYMDFDDDDDERYPF